MSDFDKEAEREKLREKYEREEEKRKTTEQMSELLLKGATMTNAHCSDCGDPIFRYDGQEFCPTCQKPVDRGTGQSDESSGGGSADADDEESGANADENGGSQGDHIEVTTPSNDASVRFGNDDGGTDAADAGAAADAAPDQPSETPDESAAEAGTRSETETGGRPEAPGGPNATETAGSTEGARDVGDVRRVPSADPSGSSAHDEAQGRGTQSPSAPGADGLSTDATAADSAGEHLGRAQVVLARTVERYARRAAEADSPREAREHLETAREAAETLDAASF